MQGITSLLCSGVETREDCMGSGLFLGPGIVEIFVRIEIKHQKSNNTRQGILFPFHLFSASRADWIRTSDLLTPSQTRYQTALRPDEQ